MRLCYLPLLLVTFVSVVSAQYQPYIACLNGAYGGGAAWTQIAQTTASSCASGCQALNKKLYLFKTGTDGTTTCQCTDVAPPASAYVTSSASAPSTCAVTQYRVAMVSSSYQWTGCPATISPMTEPQFHQITTTGMTTLKCFQACTTYAVAYIKVISSGFECYCSNAGDTTASDYGSCRVYAASPNTNYFAYQHQPDSAAAAASGYYRKRGIKARLEEMEAERRNHPHCPGHLIPCELGGDPESYECIDPQNELESCGGCVGGSFNTTLTAEPVGVDCSALPGVSLGAVTCARGRCLIFQCRRGFELIDGVCEKSSLNFQRRR